jgi:hypothetical protein
MNPKYRFGFTAFIEEAAFNVTTKFEISDYPHKMVVPESSSNFPIPHSICGVRDSASAGNHTSHHFQPYQIVHSKKTPLNTSNFENHHFKIQTIKHHLQISEGHLYLLNRTVKVGVVVKPIYKSNVD